MTERTSMNFVVKAHASGAPFIVCEPHVENLSILERGFLGFDIGNVSHEKAEEIARFMNENLAAVTYTIVPGWGR